MKVLHYLTPQLYSHEESYNSVQRGIRKIIQTDISLKHAIELTGDNQILIILNKNIMEEKIREFKMFQPVNPDPEWIKINDDPNYLAVAGVVLDYLRDAFEINLYDQNVTPDTEINSLLDSLDVIELNMKFEKEFGIQISDEEMEKIVKLRDIIKLLEEKITYKLPWPYERKKIEPGEAF